VDGVELDACNLADGSFVVQHDGWLELGSERVALPTLQPDDPRVVAAGLQPLEPVLEELADANILIVFDWKGFGAEQEAARLLARYGLVTRTLLSTSVTEALARFRDAEPRLATGLTVPRLSKRMPPAGSLGALARRWGCSSVMLEKHFVSAPVVSAIREAGLGLFLWTAKTRQEFDELLRFQPDGIMTDAV
jgi:glycerophosphoryl diester phosphodiesterase